MEENREDSIEESATIDEVELKMCPVTLFWVACVMSAPLAFMLIRLSIDSSVFVSVWQRLLSVLLD